MTSKSDNTAYENAILDQLRELRFSYFRVMLSLQHVFVCGGIVDIKQATPPSFRDRFLRHASGVTALFDSIVLAERFKDYFKENAYPDLFMFENEIASISSLVIIFLESPGSLVELGMFCAVPRLQKKMLIVAPREHTESGDSFIFLGPLENVKKKSPGSVLVYPWPRSDEQDYSVEHLHNLCDSIVERIAQSPKTAKFDQEEPGHLIFLIAELIRICYPVTVTEIEIGLLALEIDVQEAVVNRAIYLLSKLRIIRRYEYSGYDYYHPVDPEEMLVSFSAGKSFDVQAVRMSLRQSYVLNKDSASKKRVSALRAINAQLEKDA